MLYPILAFTGSGEADSLAVGRGRHSEGGTRKRDRSIITKAEKDTSRLWRYQCRGSRGGCELEEGSEPSNIGVLILLRVLSAERCGVTSVGSL